LTVAIIDYRMGNIRSVANAVEALGYESLVAAEPRHLVGASHLILPGVGAFGDGMRNLRAGGWVDALDEEVRRKGKPFLGICLGMQFLATTSTEHGTHAGLGWIPGEVRPLPAGDPRFRVPHIGWDDVRPTRREGLFAGLGETEVFYFVHSYALAPDDSSLVSGACEYGVRFAAGVEIDNIWAVQFHPEKSQRAGLAVLRNFLETGARAC